MKQNCRVCGILLNNETSPPSLLKGNQGDCRKCFAKKKRDRYKVLRANVIELLGNCCELCDQEEQYLLNIDHIDGGGNQEKQNLRGFKFLRHILNMDNTKQKYRILCYNCNYSKGFYGITGAEVEKLL